MPTQQYILTEIRVWDNNSILYMLIYATYLVSYTNATGFFRELGQETTKLLSVKRLVLKLLISKIHERTYFDMTKKTNLRFRNVYQRDHTL